MCRLWASVRLGHLTDRFYSWMPVCVFGAGGGRSSVEGWSSNALDIEEVLAGIVDSGSHWLLQSSLSRLTPLIGAS